VRRRIALLAVLGAFLVVVPASASATGLSSVVSPVTRLLCGCNPAAAARSTVEVVGSRVRTVSMSIVHVVRGCHVWALGAKQLSAKTVVRVKPGTKLKLRITCPMDFDIVQVSGPKLRLGGARFYTGSTRVIVFRKAGLYKFVAKNVQTSEEVGLQTLGEDNLLRLTIRVK
jgi:hypothetical protein